MKAQDDEVAYNCGSEPAGSSRRVYAGIIKDLEARRLVPGQRLIETDLSRRFEVGRNAVREAIQHLAARGVVELSLNRSPAIRHMSFEEAMDVLDVASVMTQLVAKKASEQFDAVRHGAELAEICASLHTAALRDEDGAFNRSRRQFYRLLLMIGGSGELQRLFPAIGMHIVHAQYASDRLREVRLADYTRIARSVGRSDAAAAMNATADHIENVRTLIAEVGPR